MKILPTFTLAVALCVAATAVQARPLEAVRKDGTLLIATEGHYAPFNFFQGKQLTGFEVEVAELVARKMGLTPQWKTLSFDALLTGLQQDRWDVVIASHAITEERARAVTFAAPHYCSGGTIVSMTPTLRSAGDLAGKTVSVQTGTTYAAEVQRLPGIQSVKNFPADTDARNALVSKRVDAMVTDRFVAKELLRKSPKAGFHLGEMVTVERIAAAMALGNTGLADAWSQALQAVMADGSYAKVSQKYFQEDIRCPAGR
ncbi:ABC transporter substrate-binding protein [Pantoea sp. 18069]|uniref:ABC transporter substrate-binding protein n=1 Tax=Pantoea sp. 18069 TaxID=2681415 RepID=UPI00135907D0|nr:ABC transporter substrate-binding protein [Pantoea sp. 18069]